MLRRIAVDAMGGDSAPGPEIEGSLDAARARPIEVIVVGDEAVLRERLSRFPPLSGPGRISIRHASQVVTMDDHPGLAFKTKKDSSMRVAFNLVLAGEADAVVSAGNSGAILALGLFVMKRLPGVERPGIMTLCPTQNGSWCVVLDVGANTELRPASLAQFAVLGAAYARTALGKTRPRVAVLSNGEENSKGTELTREAHRILGGIDPGDEGLEFCGYAEGRDFFPGRFDVIVTDGFTGNIALKTSEGTMRAVFDMLRAEIEKSAVRKLGALLLRPAFLALRRRFEPEEQGGAPLLGLNGVAVVSHGRATAKAIKNAIFAADRLVDAGLTPALAAAIARYRKLWDADGDSPPGTAAEG